MTTTTSHKAIPVPRGCGTRVSGGIYAECGLGPDGAPIENFLIDPPVLVPTEMGLTAIGVKVFQNTKDGLWHIADWVGSEHYPNVADFIEEVKNFGMSRRLPKNLDFSKLTFGSRVILAHARAHVANFTQYADAWANVRYQRCPKERQDHNLPDAPDMCLGVAWQDIEGGTPLLPSPEAALSSGEGPGVGARVVKRTMPSFNYIAAARPEGLTPQYAPAFFASFPISRIAVVRGQSNEHQTGYQSASASTLPVDLCDE